MSRLLAAISARDHDALGELLAEDVVFHSPVQTYRGRDQVLRLLVTIGGVIDDVNVTRHLEDVTFFAAKIPEADAGHAVGLYLIAWGIFTAYMFIASLRTTAAIALVFLLLTLTFLVLGIGDAGGNENITKLGGYIGLATAAAAWYASFAVVTNSTFGRTMLPVKPLAR